CLASGFPHLIVSRRLRKPLRQIVNGLLEQDSFVPCRHKNASAARLAPDFPNCYATIRARGATRLGRRIPWINRPPFAKQLKAPLIVSRSPPSLARRFRQRDPRT